MPRATLTPIALALLSLSAPTFAAEDLANLVNQGKVSKITFPDISPFYNAKTVSHSMAHLLSNFFQADFSHLVIVKH